MKSSMLSVKIAGMHCVSCEKVLAEVIEDIAGVKHAAVSVKTGIARVEFDAEQVAEPQLKKLVTAAVNDEGYKVAE